MTITSQPTLDSRLLVDGFLYRRRFQVDWACCYSTCGLVIAFGDHDRNADVFAFVNFDLCWKIVYEVLVEDPGAYTREYGHYSWYKKERVLYSQESLSKR